MKVLHVAPGDSAGGSLREALRLAGYQQDVLSFTDDLSCGPIAWGTSRERAAWWSHVHEPRLEDDLETFWLRLETANERLVVWFGRHSASELAFFLALADRLGDRPYDIVDVTDLQWTSPGLMALQRSPARRRGRHRSDRPAGGTARNRTPHLTAGGRRTPGGCGSV